MSEFLNMGGYGLYVWPSYAIAALVLGANLWWPWRRHRRLKARIEREVRQ